jgi:hypothetical protein
LGCSLQRATRLPSVRGKKSRRTNGGTADARRCLSSAPAYRGGCAVYQSVGELFAARTAGVAAAGGRSMRPASGLARSISSVAPTHDALFLVVAFLMYYIRFCPNEWFRSRRRDSSCAVQHALFRATVAAWYSCVPAATAECGNRYREPHRVHFSDFIFPSGVLN